MSRAAHTPGPWRERQGEVQVDGGVVAIAFKSGVVTEGQMRANARLMAAAPDLLEALEGLLSALPSATTHPAIQAARAAIAKATGEQP